MDGADEATEMTAMTGGDSGASTPGEDGLNSTGVTTRSGDLRGAWYKRYIGTPTKKRVLAVVIFLLLSLTAYLVSKIIIGSLYMYSCQMDPFIPIYLVISATLLIAFIVVVVVIVLRTQQSGAGDEENEEEDDRVHPLHLVIFVYLFIHMVLQLAGSVCVIRTRNDVITQTQEEIQLGASTCDGTLITFSFGAVIFELVLSSLCLILALVTLCEVIYLVCCQQGPHKTQPQHR